MAGRGPRPHVLRPGGKVSARPTATHGNAEADREEERENAGRFALGQAFSGA